MEPKDFVRGSLLFIGALFFLYFFLVFLDLLGNSFKVVAGDSAGSLFDAVDNPIAGLMVGILATVMVQSSSTTTSVIVSAVGSGVLPVPTAIPMVMGANIGTSVTNTIVSMGFITNKEELRLGFAGATVHDMFNYMNVLFWLPLEIIVGAINPDGGGILFIVSEAAANSFTACEAEDEDDCSSWDGPLKTITGELSDLILNADSDVTKDFAQGEPSFDFCVDDTDFVYKFNSKRCFTGEIGLLADPIGHVDTEDCTKPSFNFCAPEFSVSNFTNAEILAGAVEHYNSYELNKEGILYEYGLQEPAGWIGIVISLIGLIICLIGLVKMLSTALQGQSQEIVQWALNMNGYLAILVGTGLTMFVQSSSITTSTLTPLVALGTLSLEGMLPLTLGANIGTTMTGILASLVGSSRDGFQIAMVHVLFNVFGVVLFYPIPFIRSIPIGAARRLGNLASKFRIFPVVYILMLFVVYPGVLLGVSVAFGNDEIGAGVAGVLCFVIAHALFLFWYFAKGGKEKLAVLFAHDFDDDMEKAQKVDEIEPASA